MIYSVVILQVVLAIALSVVILLQPKGSGLGQAFGSDGGFRQTRRGFEKMMFNTTIILAILFILTSLANVILI